MNNGEQFKKLLTIEYEQLAEYYMISAEACRYQREHYKSVIPGSPEYLVNLQHELEYLRNAEYYWACAQMTKGNENGGTILGSPAVPYWLHRARYLQDARREEISGDLQSVGP